VLFVVGNIGEPLHPKASDAPVAFLVVWRVVGIGLAIGLIGLAGTELHRKVRGVA